MEGLSGTVMNLAEVECEWVKKGNSLTVVAVACGAINSANITFIRSFYHLKGSKLIRPLLL